MSETFYPAILVEIIFPDGAKEVELTGTLTCVGKFSDLYCISWDNTIYTPAENNVIDTYVLNMGVNLEDRFIAKIDLET